MKLTTAVAIILTLTASLEAQVLRDDFSAQGSLTGTTPDIGNPWTTISGTSGQLQVVSGRVRLTSAGDEDVQSSFSIQTGITLFGGFTLNYASPPTNSGEVTISFRAAQGYVGRIFLGQGSSASTFRIGIDNNLDNPVYWPTQLNISTDYRIVLGFTESGSSDRTTLWVNPASINDPSVAEPQEAVTAGITGFSFRQGGSSGTLAVDDLYVGSDFGAAAVPEPSAMILSIFGVLALVIGLRRRTEPNHAMQLHSPRVTPAAPNPQNLPEQPSRRAPSATCEHHTFELSRSASHFRSNRRRSVGRRSHDVCRMELQLTGRNRCRTS